MTVAMRNTARVIHDLKADVLAVVEAESRPVPEQFNQQILKAVGGQPGTHGLCNASNKIDYMLLSPKLHQRVQAGGVMRQGMWPGVRPRRWETYADLDHPKNAAADLAASAARAAGSDRSIETGVAHLAAGADGHDAGGDQLAECHFDRDVPGFCRKKGLQRPPQRGRFDRSFAAILRRFSVIFLISSADTVDERAGSVTAGAETGPIAAPVLSVAATFTAAGAIGFTTAGFTGAAFVAGADFAAAAFFAAGLTIPWDCRRTTNPIALACSSMGS